MNNKYWVVVPVALSMAMALSVAEAAKKKSQEEDSVYQWGRWEVLAPAGGTQPVANLPQQIALLSTDDYEKKVNPISPPESEPEPGPGPEPGPEPIAVICEAGATCGFATRNLGGEALNDENARFNTFSETVIKVGDPDEGHFLLNEGEGDQIDSGTMSVRRNRDNTALYAKNTDGAVMKSANYDGSSGAGIWFFAGEESETGWFAVGDAFTQSALDELNAGNVLAQFSGPMASGLTNVDLSVQFGGAPSWQGEWSGAHNFQAAGDVVGPSLVQTSITNATGQVDGFVAGATDNMAAILKVDVETGGSIYRDVGRIPGAMPN